MFGHVLALPRTIQFGFGVKKQPRTIRLRIMCVELMRVGKPLFCEAWRLGFCVNPMVLLPAVVFVCTWRFLVAPLVRSWFGSHPHNKQY